MLVLSAYFHYESLISHLSTTAYVLYNKDVGKLLIITLVLVLAGLGGVVVWQWYNWVVVRKIVAPIVERVGITDSVTKAVEVEGKPGVFPTSGINGIFQNHNLKAHGQIYPLSGEGVVVGRIFRKTSGQSTSKVDLSQLTEGDRIYLDYYRYQKSVWGVVDSFARNSAVWRLKLYANPEQKVYDITAETIYEVSDSSKMFDLAHQRIDSLSPGDSVELSLGENGQVAKLTYHSPVLGGNRGKLQAITQADQGATIQVEGVPTQLAVDFRTTIYDESKPTHSLTLDQLKVGDSVWTLYYMDRGVMRVASLGLSAK